MYQKILAILVLCCTFIAFSFGATLGQNPQAPFCFPTQGTLGYRYSEKGHGGIDIWTGVGWDSLGQYVGNDVAPPGNPIFLPYPGILRALIYNNTKPNTINTIQGLIFRHQIDSSYSDIVPELEVDTLYVHMANENTGESYVNPELIDKIGQSFPANYFLGYQGNQRWNAKSKNEDVITHLHFGIYYVKDDPPPWLKSNYWRDPSPYLGYQLNVKEPNTLQKGYVFSETCTPITSTPWPMFGYDPQHTGQSPYLGPQSDNLKWVYSLLSDGWRDTSSPAITSDGTLYIGDGNGINAIDSNGNLKWIFSTGYSTSSSPAIGTDGTVYFGSNDGALYAVSSNGDIQWKYSMAATYHSSPTVSPDGTIYILTINGFYAINPDGTLKWNLGFGGYSSPAIAADGTIYVNSYSLYAINPDGSVRWTYPLSQQYSSPAIAVDGTIYVGGLTENSIFYAINPNGTLKWSYDTGFNRPGPSRYASYSHPSIGKDGTIYIGSNDGNLYAIKPDGGLKWKYTFADGTQNLYLFYSSAAIGSDGTVYIGGNDGVYAFNPDGTVKWSYPTGWIYSSPAIGSNGTLYIRSGSQLYTFGPP